MDSPHHLPIPQGSSTSRPPNPHPAPIKVKAPKWYLAYFLLAAFDLLTISGSLYLNHTIMNMFSNSVSVNHEWANRLGELAILRVLAGETNAPGNDVFDTHDVDGESKKLQVALKAFVQHRDKMEQELSHHLSPDEAAPLLKDFQMIQTKLDEMVEEAQLIYSFFLASQPERAGERMATMDRKYAMVHAAITTVETQFRSTQVALLNHQEMTALRFQRFEYVIALFIVLMVGAASFYGHRIYREMTRSAQEKEQFLIELARNRDHLQEQVEERTHDLRVAKDTAEKANQGKSEFLANMSHELRTPMHSIISFAEMAFDDLGTAPPDKILRFLTRIRESADRLLGLLNDLLDLSKLESGMMTLSLEQRDLRAIVKKVENHFELLFKEKGLTCTMQEPHVPTILECDPEKMEQVMLNLLSNAIKFSSTGKTITVSMWSDTLPAGRRETDVETVTALAVRVKDEGVGIPEEELELVFDKFVQSSHTKTGAGGTGLGLAICQEIIRAHGGKIWAENGPEGGAAFTFILPLHPTMTNKLESDIRPSSVPGELVGR